MIYKACLKTICCDKNIFESGEALHTPGRTQSTQGRCCSCDSLAVWNSLVLATKTHLSLVRNIFLNDSLAAVSVLPLWQISQCYWNACRLRQSPVDVNDEMDSGPGSLFFFFFYSSWETLLFTCTEEERVGEGIHSSCSGCVLVDMARLYKILRAVSSQRPVSKHAASVCPQASLSLRPQYVRITQSESSSAQQDEDQILSQSRTALRHFLWTSLDLGFQNRIYSLMVLGILIIKHGHAAVTQKNIGK